MEICAWKDEKYAKESVYDWWGRSLKRQSQTPVAGVMMIEKCLFSWELLNIFGLNTLNFYFKSPELLSYKVHSLTLYWGVWSRRPLVCESKWKWPWEKGPVLDAFQEIISRCCWVRRTFGPRGTTLFLCLKRTMAHSGIKSISRCLIVLVVGK